jgi:2-iminobutanoate/2-iminopropanoate deaminase
MAEPLKRSYLKRETAQARGYSQAVVTEGGRVIWLAGQVAAEDSAGRSLAADFDGQVREVLPGWAAPSKRPAAGSPTW